MNTPGSSNSSANSPLDSPPNAQGAPTLLERLDAGSASLVPPRPSNASGLPRKVGVEIEFAGLDLDTVAGILVRRLGGTVQPETDYELELDTPRLGKLRLEIDDSRLKRLGREKEEGELGWVGSSAEGVLSALAGRITPIELVTAPLEVSDLVVLDELVAELGAAGARGTADGVLSAFGTHFNPEVASTEPGDLLAHIRAFVLLYDWLCLKIDVNLTRKLTPYVDPYPPAYVERVLSRESKLSITELIDEYLADNPTRNRALDLLPLFAHLDPERVQAATDDELVKARPTFHYRLSNSRVGDADWALTDPWKLWLIVEDLANDPERLRAMSAAYLERSKETLFSVSSAWATETESWLG